VHTRQLTPLAAPPDTGPVRAAARPKITVRDITPILAMTAVTATSRWVEIDGGLHSITDALALGALSAGAFAGACAVRAHAKATGILFAASGLAADIAYGAVSARLAIPAAIGLVATIVWYAIRGQHDAPREEAARTRTHERGIAELEADTRLQIARIQAERDVQVAVQQRLGQEAAAAIVATLAHSAQLTASRHPFADLGLLELSPLAQALEQRPMSALLAGPAAPATVTVTVDQEAITS
jgi:hypothetical protein